MQTVDYFFTTLSPYAYLAGTELEEIARRHGARITYRPVDPTGLFARTGGLALKDRHQSRRDYRLQDLRRRSVARGMVLNLQPQFWPANPAPSAYAIIAAQASRAADEQGDLGGLVHGFMRAVWAENRDIADDDTIRALLQAHGFDAGLADRGMLLGAETYAANLEEAVSRGVFGIPFYITGDDERFWGQDRLGDLDLVLAGRL